MVVFGCLFDPDLISILKHLGIVKSSLGSPQNAFLDKDVPALYICPQMTPIYRFL